MRCLSICIGFQTPIAIKSCLQPFCLHNVIFQNIADIIQMLNFTCFLKIKSCSHKTKRFMKVFSSDLLFRVFRICTNILSQFLHEKLRKSKEVLLISSKLSDAHFPYFTLLLINPSIIHCHILHDSCTLSSCIYHVYKYKIVICMWYKTSWNFHSVRMQRRGEFQSSCKEPSYILLYTTISGPCDFSLVFISQYSRKFSFRSFAILIRTAFPRTQHMACRVEMLSNLA